MSQFWLAVIVRNLFSECPYTTITMLEVLCWYLWHFSFAAIPEFLRAPMLRAYSTIDERLTKSWCAVPRLC